MPVFFFFFMAFLRNWSLGVPLSQDAMECWEQGNVYMKAFIYLSVNQILKANLKGADLVGVGEESTDDF